MKIPRGRLISLQKKSQTNAAILVIAEQSVNALKLLDTDYIYICVTSSVRREKGETSSQKFIPWRSEE